MRNTLSQHDPLTHLADVHQTVHQRGIALAVALILLVIVTLIGLAAVRGATVQQRMTANFYDRELAFQNTEAGLRAAEALIQAGPPNVRDCTLTQCQANPYTDPNFDSTSAMDQAAATAEYTAGTNAPGQPQFVIELVCAANCASPTGGSNNFSQSANFQGYGTQQLNGAQFQIYRVTARSCDPTSDACANRAVVTLQALYAKPT